VKKTRRSACLQDLAEHRLDVLLLDNPVTSLSRVRAFNHALGSCGVTIFGAKSLAASYRKGFPKSLDGAPFLLPDRRIQSPSLARPVDEPRKHSTAHCR
jgi:LysR family transcriptional activator of nhaA